MFRFTTEQITFLQEAYASMPRRLLTEAFNARFGADTSEEQIVSLLKRRRIRSERTGRFPKGHMPFNKGTKGYMKANAGSFQRGRAPHNKRRLWSERITRDGHIEISVPERNPRTGAPTRFKPKHIWLWEMKYGPVPKGHALLFSDGNPLNCEIDNLTLVTRAELLCVNIHGHRAARDELKPSVLALARLEAKAGFRMRSGGGRTKDVERGSER